MVSGAQAQETSCTPAPPGLVSWWQGESSTADVVGGNDGTIAGAGLVTYGPGVVGQAFVFDGTHRDRIDLGNPATLHLQDFTLEAWVKRSSPTVTSFDVLGADGSDCGDGACIIGYGRGGYILAVANNGRLILSRTDIDGITSTPLLTDTNWHYVAVTKAGTNAVFYLDGQPQATPPYVENGPYTFDDGTCSCNAAIAVGSRGDARGGTFYGAIDEPAIFNRALSPGEVQSIYAAGSAGMCVNNWTNPSSAKWESPSWSLGVLPGPDQTVEIMNDGYKAVNIDSTTVVDLPSSLTVGSLGIGAPTNAASTLLLNYFGLDTPLKVLNSCVLEPNGTLLNLGSSFEVDGTNGGTMTIDGGTFNQVGGLTVVNAPVIVHSGYINVTNANLTLGDVTLDSTDPVNTLNQQGGSIALQHLDVHNGRYWMFAGTLYAIAGTTTDGGGNFLQWGGTNYGDITVTAGDYDLAGGMAKGNSLSVSSGFGVEAGAVLDMQSINWLGAYATLSGSVRCDTFNTVNTGPLYFSGDIIVTNTLNLTGSSNSTFFTDFVRLVGGTLSAGTITLRDFSWMDQYDGSTNEVSSGLTLQGSVSAGGVEQLCQYLLWGGLLETPYLGVGTHAIYTQHSGQNFVHGVLSISGDYEFFGGQLVVDGIWLAGALVLNAPQPPGTGTVTNTGLMDLNGTLATGLADAWPGQVRLSASATVGFLGTPAQLHFAPSSELSWTPGALLAVTNWNNVANVHIFFGNDASALTAAQLAQIQFVNPGGFPPGSYPAQLLSTGELIPVARPTLQAARTGSALVFTWPGNFQLLSATNVAGPYATVSGATSPWTNYFTQPQQFFRLQAP